MRDRILAAAADRRMILIPAGPFLFGPRKVEVTLNEFWIDPYPVTNSDLARVVPGHRFVPHRASHPATWVSWESARRYLEETGLDLPTQQQWEKAARGVDGRLYPWGDDHDPRRFNVLESGIGETTAVDRYSKDGASPYGVMDMAGNVWEWTLTEARRDNVMPGRVVCGASYERSWFEIQSGVAGYEVLDPKNGYPTVGFRGVANL
jgi:formylglycine-generating enzyme required for sulfatase activity